MKGKSRQFLQTFGWLSLLVILLTGCLYPNERRMENQTPLMEQVARVQQGIDQFFQENRVLPILTKEMHTPIFEKYVIDWSQVVPRYLPAIPRAAFEQGGTFLFVLTNVEKQPQVRVYDLKLAANVAEIQTRVNNFYQRNKSLPVAGESKANYFFIDFSKIGVKAEKGTVESPYTRESLPIVMSYNGVVAIDYTSDLKKMLGSNQVDLSALDDIRFVFTDNSIYAPVKSFPYTIQDDNIQLNPQ
jgi:hypothetical protein